MRPVRPGITRSRRHLVALTAAPLIAAGLVTGVSAIQAQAAAGCAVTYTTSDWDGGFTAGVSIKNLGDAVNGWTLGFTFPDSGQKVSSGWSATWSQSGRNVTAKSMDWNAAIASGGSVEIGFNGLSSGPNPKPSSFTLNGAACTGSTDPGSPTPTPTDTPPPGSGTCDTALSGWAAVAGAGRNSTTGGGDATPQTITTLGDLQKYAGDSTARVLRISGTINTGTSAVNIASNKTLVGADKNATIQGGLNIESGHSNIIVRNLNIRGPGYGHYPADTLAARGSDHLWFDHLNVQDAGDGLLDLTKGSDFLTVSWVKFWYTDRNNSHRFASLISAGADHDSTDAGKENATFHHNWFAELVDQRMPRMLFGKGHVYNNYYTATGNTYAVGVGALASVLIENNYFKGTHNPHQFMYDRPSYITARGNAYDNTSGKRDSGAGGTGGGVTPFTNPPYSYKPDTAADVPGIVSRCAGPQ
ncbi:cellulose binding domain-containing protein [Actinomadura sp. NPDC000600]|uniref:cellulose binding domain-containing protein n=1 Tax=Actinomadura sp. NPDC000600 TaxID=3154262 RepID=UPI003395F494